MNSKRITRKNMNISEALGVLLFCEFDSFYTLDISLTFIYLMCHEIFQCINSQSS